MTFASDAHRKWWFANHGGCGSSGSGGGGGCVPSFPAVTALNGHWHTINVCGQENQVWVETDDVSTPSESAAIADKEDRKASDMHQIMGGGWK